LEFPEDILASLRSGIDLCRLVNTIQPGIVSINTEDNESAHTENLRAYLDACYNLGVNTYDLFEPQDLSQDGDVQRVLRNIVALERTCVDNGYGGTRIDIVDACDRKDCMTKIEELVGEVGSLKRQLHDKDEDNTELRLENHDFKDKITRQEDEIFQLKTRIQNLEQSNQESAEKYNLAMIDVQIVKLDHERLQKQLHDLNAAAEAARIANDNNNNDTGKSEGSPRLKFFNKNNSSPDLKKLDDKKKFIKREKKELIRIEKERKKKEGKKEGKEGKKEGKKRASKKDESKSDGLSPPNHDAQKLSRGIRSLTLSRISKPKDKEKSIRFSGQLEERSQMQLSKSVDNIPETPVEAPVWSPASSPAAAASSAGRDRSATAAGRLMSLVKPNSKNEGNATTTVERNNNTTTVAVYDVPHAS